MIKRMDQRPFLSSSADETGRQDQAMSQAMFQTIFEMAGDGLILHDLESGRVVAANPAAGELYGYSAEQFVGLHPTHFVHPEGLGQFADYLRMAHSAGRFESQQAHLHRDGRLFHVELHGTALTVQGRRCVLSVLRDISQQVLAERRLQQRMDAHTREQASLLEISQTLASALELQPGLILDQLRMMIEYTHAGLFTLNDSTLTLLAGRGPQWKEIGTPFQIQLGDPEPLAMLFNGKGPARIADVQGNEAQAAYLRRLLAEQASWLLEGVRSWMWVPLAIKGRVIGAVGVAHAVQDHFTAHDADLALTVANQAAITMVNSDLYENARLLASLEERQRLARNLHDAVNQSLFSAGLIAEVLPRLWERDPQEGRRSLEDLRRLTRGAQADMRLLLAELRPSTLTDAKLGDLLRLLGNALSGRTNIPVHLNVSGEADLPADVQVALYRMCQEGLSNIAKHAEASRVDLGLQFETGAVELRIRDDGRGFDPNQPNPGHYGLSMMQERAAAVGADLSIASQPGLGVEIVIRWTETEAEQAGGS